MRYSRKQSPAVYVFGGLSILLLIACTLLTIHCLRLTESDRDKALVIGENNRQLAEQEQQIAADGERLAEFEARCGEYEDRLLQLDREIEQLNLEADGLSVIIERLTDEKTAESEVLAEYVRQLASVSEQLTAKEEALAHTTCLLDSFRKLVSNNHGYSSERMTELFDLLENQVPLRAVRVEPAEASTEETGEATAETEVAEVPEFTFEKANVAYYYKDLTTGYTMSFNETEVLYSASLIKAPYIYAILEEIDAFEEQKRNFSSDGTPLYDEDKKPLFEGEHPNLTEDGAIRYDAGEEKYDLSRKWVFDKKTMMKEGSGEILNMEDGTEMTYRELVEYALLYSDNIAFAELRKVFGMTSFNQKVSELAIEGTAHGFMDLTAEDCGKFLSEMYRYFETESDNALLMKDCMTRSKHTVMIVSALSGRDKTVAHKYGWDIDAYHDMAIVYDEHPYILVIMTNLHDGGAEPNAYVGKLTRLTDDIHASHYS